MAVPTKKEELLEQLEVFYGLLSIEPEERDHFWHSLYDDLEKLLTLNIDHLFTDWSLKFMMSRTNKSGIWYIGKVNLESGPKGVGHYDLLDPELMDALMVLDSQLTNGEMVYLTHVVSGEDKSLTNQFYFARPILAKEYTAEIDCVVEAEAESRRYIAPKLLVLPEFLIRYEYDARLCEIWVGSY